MTPLQKSSIYTQKDERSAYPLSRFLFVCMRRTNIPLIHAKAQSSVFNYEMKAALHATDCSADECYISWLIYEHLYLEETQ